MNRETQIDSENALDAASIGSEIPSMAENDQGQMHLHRIDPARNMRRFYALSLQPTRFGGASVIRHWGRIGTGGQSMMETFDRPADAISALGRLERVKRRRGYQDAGAPDSR